MNPPHTSGPAPERGDWRTEHDSMGAVRVPAQALYGAQTQRAVLNFPVSGQPMPPLFVRALLQLKAAAAQANGELQAIPAAEAGAIEQACAALLALDDAALMLHFPVDVFQTGSGTSSHMNANEVIATLASRALGTPVHPNDQVNASQSSNDMVPSAIHVAAALALHQRLLPALDHLVAVTQTKAAQTHAHVKTGRTTSWTRRRCAWARRWPAGRRSWRRRRCPCALRPPRCSSSRWAAPRWAPG